jgi:hypothetical protein
MRQRQRLDITSSSRYQSSPDSILPSYTSNEAPIMSGPSPSPGPLEDPNNSKQWMCSECNDAFSQSKLLETHAIETDHKAYHCTKETSCAKLFTLRSSWIRHERIHSAQKSHACSRCRKRFHRKDNCYDHERTCGRVARRARVPMHSVPTQSVSTSPTMAETTRSVTSTDPLTTIVDNGSLRYPAETGHLFHAPDVSEQRDDEPWRPPLIAIHPKMWRPPLLVARNQEHNEPRLPPLMATNQKHNEPWRPPLLAINQ